MEDAHGKGTTLRKEKEYTKKKTHYGKRTYFGEETHTERRSTRRGNKLVVET